MPRVFVPSMFGLPIGDPIDVAARTLGEVVSALRVSHPELAAKIMDGERLAPWLSVVVDGDLFPKSLAAEIPAQGEIHFIPAISGG